MPHLGGRSSDRAASLPAVSAGPFEVAIADGLRTEVDVLYTGVVSCAGWGDCAVPLDILAPTDAAGLPTVVLLHGGPVHFLERRYLDRLAAETARRGAVVFLASYRSSATGNPVTDFDRGRHLCHSLRPLGDRGVRRRSVQRRARRALLRQRTGAVDGGQPETETPGCLAEGDGRPEAAVGLAGFGPGVAGFGAALDAAAAPGPPIFMAGGADDLASLMGPDALEALKAAGFDAEYQEFPATSHDGIVDPAASPATLDLIFKAIQRARPH